MWKFCCWKSAFLNKIWNDIWHLACSRGTRMDLSLTAMGRKGRGGDDHRRQGRTDVPQSHWRNKRNAGAMEIQGTNTEFGIFHSVWVGCLGTLAGPKHLFADRSWHLIFYRRESGQCLYKQQRTEHGGCEQAEKPRDRNPAQTGMVVLVSGPIPVTAYPDLDCKSKGPGKKIRYKVWSHGQTSSWAWWQCIASRLSGRITLVEHWPAKTSTLRIVHLKAALAWVLVSQRPLWSKLWSTDSRH